MPALLLVLASTVAIGEPKVGAAGGYVPLPAPARVLDSRPAGDTVDGQFQRSGVLAAGATMTLPVGGRAGVPPTAASVALNVTVTQAHGNGFATVFPCGGAVPNASNLNYLTGDTVPNSVITGLGAAGAICIYTSAATHLIVDIAGYFADTTAFTPLAAPARVLDSRPAGDTVDGQFQRSGVLAAGATMTLPVGGRAGVPPTAASVALNVTVTQAQGNGFATVFPCGGAVPNASNLNYLTGDTVPNSVITGLGAAGAICIYTSAATHLIVDIAGYFADTTAFTPLAAPARVLDSRPAGDTVDGQFERIGAQAAFSVLTLDVGGRAGVPVGAGAVVLNVTVTDAPIRWVRHRVPARRRRPECVEPQLPNRRDGPQLGDHEDRQRWHDLRVRQRRHTSDRRRSRVPDQRWRRADGARLPGAGEPSPGRRRPARRAHRSAGAPGVRRRVQWG